MYKNYGQKVEGNVPERDYLAEYDSYINQREYDHLTSLEYGSDDNSTPSDFDWRAIHELVDWRTQTYFS